MSAELTENQRTMTGIIDTTAFPKCPEQCDCECHVPIVGLIVSHVAACCCPHRYICCCPEGCPDVNVGLRLR